MNGLPITKSTNTTTNADRYEIAKSLPPHLLEPWRTKWGAVKATMWSIALVLTLYVSLMLVRNEGLLIELWKMSLMIGTVSVTCALFNALVWWRTQRLRVEPTLGSATANLLQFTVGLPSVTLLLSNVAFQASAGSVRIPHVVFLAVFTGLLLAFFSLIYLLYWHTRLSIRDPERERRLTQQSENFSLRMENALKGLPIVGQLRPYLAVDRSVKAETQLFDLWTRRHTPILILEDTLSAVALLILVLTLKWFIATHDGEVYEVGVFSYLRFGMALLISMGIGHCTLAYLRRYCPWSQRATLTYVLPLICVQAGGAGASFFLVLINVPIELRGTVLGFMILANGYAFFGLISLLFRRFKQIAEARTIAAAQKSAIAESERARALADLKSLQAQIEPHFIYNTLANLQSLIRQEMPPAIDGTTSRSDTMIGHLIDYLRARTATMRETVAPLKKEIEMTESYLRLMQIRMGERLSYSIDIADAAREVPIPPLSIISLVENSIKHGLEPKRGSGSITITAAIVQDKLRVTVADTGRGFSADASGSGVGLSNLKERLALMYGVRAELALSENVPTGVVATLTIPPKLPLTTNSNITSI